MHPFHRYIARQLDRLLRERRASSPTRLKLYRAFYKHYRRIGPTLSDQLARLLPHADQPEIQPTASGESLSVQHLPEDISAHLAKRISLGWSHYVTLLTIDDPGEHRFYEIEAEQNHWSVRELEPSRSFQPNADVLGTVPDSLVRAQAPS